MKCGIEWLAKKLKGPKRTIDEEFRFKSIQKQRMNENASKRRKIIKMQVLMHYSHGVPQCCCCGELQYEFLTIDHTDGRKKWNHMKSFTGYRLYLWLLKNNFPDGFTVQCFNCNCAKGIFGICPHANIQHVEKVIV